MAEPAPAERRKRRAPPRPVPRESTVAEAPARLSRDDIARQALRPLGPGERPPALLAAIATAAALGLGNAAAYGAGATIQGSRPGAAVLAFTALMALLAGGMWARRYLAVLAFEALLAIVALLFTLHLMEAGTIAAAVECVAIIAAAGCLFWKLVRVMGRMAAPK